MEITSKTTGIEGIELLPRDLLIDLLKNNSEQLDDILQGYYMLRLKDLLVLEANDNKKVLNRDIANLINKSPSYVSTRIRAAKENIPVPGKQGRRSFETYELDEIIGEDIPLRIQSKIGIIPTKDLSEMLDEIAKSFDFYTKDIEWKEVYKDQVKEEKDSRRGRKRYMQVNPDLDTKEFLDKRYPLRLISKEGRLEKDMLVGYLEEAAIRFLKLANQEDLTKFTKVN